MTASKAINRLTRELESYHKFPLEWATISVNENKIFNWKVTIKGPDGSPYAGGNFVIDFEIPPEYPFKPPKVKFLTKIYHPNVLQKDGSICEEIFGNHWSPQTKLHETLFILRQMLLEPNVDSPLEDEIAEQFRNKHSLFEKTAKEWTKKYAQ